ncbi:four helix bundle protein [Umezakia sp. BLCC-F208]|uniref:four helix bundle protein n=1 Tax=Umezakia ovalisporum TaxID=75695 RepID=UPI0035B9F3BE|nr:hypothetical protein [Nostoc sp. RI_552]
MSKQFAVEERYYLTDQIGGSCPSVCANFAEAWRECKVLLCKGGLVWLQNPAKISSCLRQSSLYCKVKT